MTVNSPYIFLRDFLEVLISVFVDLKTSISWLEFDFLVRRFLVTFLTSLKNTDFIGHRRR